jgi:hypothetical protein
MAVQQRQEDGRRCPPIHHVYSDLMGFFQLAVWGSDSAPLPSATLVAYVGHCVQRGRYVASQLGVLSKHGPVLLTTLRRVPRRRKVHVACVV